MPASAIVSEQELLRLIWQATFVLVAGSMLTLFYLVIVRVITTRRVQELEKRKTELSRFFYAALSSASTPGAAVLPRLSQLDKEAVCFVALDILRSLKGKDKQRISELLVAWGIKPYLKNVLKRGKRGECIRALTLLSSFKDPKVVGILLKYSTSRDPYIQIAALHGLASRGAVEHIEEIVDVVSRAQQTNVLLISDILARFGEPAVPALLKLARNGLIRESRLAALLALGNIRSISATEALLELVQDADSEIRAQAVMALGKSGDLRAADRLIQRLDDGNMGVRAKAAQALGLIKPQNALPALTAKLDDETWWVRFRAAEALHMLGDSGIAILRSVSVQSNAAGLIAKQVLAERGG